MIVEIKLINNVVVEVIPNDDHSTLAVGGCYWQEFYHNTETTTTIYIDTNATDIWYDKTVTKEKLKYIYETKIYKTFLRKYKLKRIINEN